MPYVQHLLPCFSRVSRVRRLASGSGYGPSAHDFSHTLNDPHPTPPGPGGTLVTHLGPAGQRAELAHSASFFPLAFGLYETFLGCSFPFPAFHQARAATRLPLQPLAPAATVWLDAQCYCMPETRTTPGPCSVDSQGTSTYKCCSRFPVCSRSAFGPVLTNAGRLGYVGHGHSAEVVCAVRQVFVPAEGAAAEVQVAAGMQIGSADLLYSERAIEQARILVPLQKCLLIVSMKLLPKLWIRILLHVEG